MSTMHFEVREPVHGLGEPLMLPSLAMRQALAWWLATELVRRHPREAPSIDEEHRYGVMLDVSVAGRRISLATDGHITPHVEPLDMDSRLNWLDVLLAEDRRTYVVEQVERVLGLESPRRTPQTTNVSVGPRLLAGFLSKTALQPLQWQACCGYRYFHDDGSSPFEQMFEAMPAVDADRRAGRHAEGDYWFLCRTRDMWEPGEPVAAVDVVSGRAWSGEVGPINLMTKYEQLGRSLDALVSAVLPPAY